MGLFEDLDKLIGDFGGLAKKSVDIYGDIIGATEDIQDKKEKPEPKVTYNPNLSAGDFAFQPNWYLVGIGVLLLVIVFWSKK